MSEAVHAEDIQKHVRVYIAVFGALAVLTVVTVGVGYLHLPTAPAVILALLIAIIKGGLVAAYFMHLISERRVIFIVLIFTVAFLLAMFALFVSSYADQEGGFVVS